MPDPSYSDLPVYQCHKKVRALQIKEAFREPDAEVVTLHFLDRSYGTMQVMSDVVSRYWPHEGDYFVLYEDGYQSISPKAAFENGYKLIAGDNLDIGTL
jgi:hypothetical protein